MINVLKKKIKINKEEKYKLNILLQMYLHDISLYFPVDFNSNKYFCDSEECAYFLMVDDNIVGFTLVDKTEIGFCIQEFFIMNNYKRIGLGKKFSFKSFNKYYSNWIIKTLPKSVLAENFWESVINDYTNVNYEKELVGKYYRVVFGFGNK